MKLIYLAHPISGDVESNLRRARRWLRWMYDVHPEVAVVSQWLPCCEVLDDDTPTHRELGMTHDLAILERCDEVWLVGGVVSNGMGVEKVHAIVHGIKVVDLTAMGPEPPREVA